MHLLRTATAIATVALALGAAQTMAPSPAKAAGDALVWGEQLPAGLDPHAIYDVPMQLILLNAYDGLVRYVGNPPELVPWLAESWTVSDDGLTWMFTLRDGATFHDGSPVTADDVVYSFQRLLSLGKAPSGAFSPVLSAENVTAIDERTVQFVLDKPYAPFLSALPIVAIVNQELVKANAKDGDWGTDVAVLQRGGLRRLQLDPSTYRPQEVVDLERYPDHFIGWDENPIRSTRSRCGRWRRPRPACSP